MTRALIIALCTVLCCGVSQAQEFKLQETSEIVITGTSSMHDWESKVAMSEGTISLKILNGKVTSINSLDLVFEVESIESGKNRMDKLTYKAFDSDDNPNITFKMTEVKSLNDISAIIVGNLTMAGNTQSIEIAGTIESKNGEVLVVASQKLDMTEFGMERPTAMLGAIKVGAEVTIKFNLSFK